MNGLVVQLDKMSYKGVGEVADYDSNFGDTQESGDRDGYYDQRQKRQDAISRSISSAKATSSVFRDEVSKDEGNIFEMSISN